MWVFLNWVNLDCWLSETGSIPIEASTKKGWAPIINMGKKIWAPVPQRIQVEVVEWSMWKEADALYNCQRGVIPVKVSRERARTHLRINVWNLRRRVLMCYRRLTHTQCVEVWPAFSRPAICRAIFRRGPRPTALFSYFYAAFFQTALKCTPVLPVLLCLFVWSRE